MKSNGWSEEHSEALKALVTTSGLSYAQIVIQLNSQCGTTYTRNSCIGRARRMGVIAPGRVRAPRKPRKPQKYKPRAQKSHQRYAAGRFYEAFENPEAVELRCVEIVPRNLTLAEISDNECRYIPGSDHLYCGHPVKSESAYCVPHHHLVWMPPKLNKPVARKYHGTNFASRVFA